MNSKAFFHPKKKPDELIPSALSEDSANGYCDSDVSNSFVAEARQRGLIAWDIETSGLDWRSQRIGLCQVWIPENQLCLIKMRKNTIPSNLSAILEDSSIKKIFHHAMFDLRFLSYHWRVSAANIACTKIAAKVLNPEQPEGHSLATLLAKYLSINLDKSNRKSDWLSWDLSNEQIEYAKADVVYLPRLLVVLEKELSNRNLLDLAHRCFAYLPTQVELEIKGYKDIYGY